MSLTLKLSCGKSIQITKQVSVIVIQFLLTAALIPAYPQDSVQPNVIIILADDVGYGIPTINGGQSYSTPNIDSMARHGMNFTHCEASPLCSPSRFMLLTGKYNFRNYSNWGFMNKSEKTIGNMMKDAGYTTGFFGKLQLDGNDSAMHNWGFDKYTICEISGQKFSFFYKNPTLLDNGTVLPDSTISNKYGDDILTQKLCDFIDSNQTKPFFAYYPMPLVHLPYSPTPDDPEFASWNPKLHISDTSFFPSMIKYMDKKIGMIIDKLKADGLDQNTILIFSGDNGTPPQIVSIIDDEEVEGEKGSITELGTHVPLIAYWPGHIAEGSVNDDLIDFSDFFPTLADIANATNLTSYGPLDGRSFLPQLLGQAGNPKDWLFLHYNPQPGYYDTLKRWVRNKVYKLYDSTGFSRSGNFYNILNDKDEKTPLRDSLLTLEEGAIKQQFLSILDTIGNAPPTPVLKNRAVTSITHNSAIIGATIISDGGAPIIERGSILAFPPTFPQLVSLFRLPDTSAAISNGPFTQVRSNLQSQTKYNYNLYAMNSNNSNSTGYGTGGEILSSFFTLSNPPSSQPASFTATASYCSIILRWGNAKFPSKSVATNAGYLLIYSTSIPTLVNNPNGKNLSQVVSNGIILPLISTKLPTLPAATATISSLSKDSAYHFLLIPYTWNGVNDSTYNYLTAGALAATQTPLASILLISAVPTSPSCFGGNDGTIAASVSRGTPPYLLNINSGSYDTISFFSNLTAGTYLLTAKDAKGCFASKTATIKAPVRLLLTTTIDSASCKGASDGSVTITGSGGASPYLYNLNGGAYDSSSTFGSLAAATYTVAIKDKNNCVSSKTAIVKQPLQLLLVATADSASCRGASDGSVTLKGSGGTSPYLYNLNGGSYDTISIFSSLAAGSYAVSVKDKHGCVASKTAFIRQPLQLSLTTLVDSASCIGASDGSVTITGSGGTSPYLYNLNGGTYNTSSTFGSLSAGSYTVSIKDKNDCIVSKTIVVSQVNKTCAGAFTSYLNTEDLISKDGETKVTVFPNPSLSEFQLVLNDKSSQPALIRVYDMYGQLVYTAKGVSNHTCHFGDKFIPGIYLLQVQYGDMIKTIKIVKGKL